GRPPSLRATSPRSVPACTRRARAPTRWSPPWTPPERRIAGLRGPVGFDAHNHLDFSEFDADRESVVRRAHAAGITGWVIAGSDHTDWDRTERVAAHTGGHAVLGVHPWETPHLSAAELQPFLDDLATRTHLVGIGEIGLDALHVKTDAQRANQRHALRAQLAL